MLSKLLFGKNDNIGRRTYFWSMASSITFSFQSALFLLIANRVSGETEAGIFMILFTTAQTINAIGNYNLRDYQVSDINADFSFATYYSTRWLTCLVMVFAAAGYAIFKSLSFSSILVLFSLVAYRFIECLEDVYHGMIHRAGRFDVTSLCMTARIVISSFVFCITYIFTRNQVVSALLLPLSSLVVFFVTIPVLKKKFSLTPSLDFSQTLRLLIVCFPLFIGAFLYSYLINAPKYAIDSLLSSDAQTVYNILFMPVFVINVLSMFIYKPLIVKLTRFWVDGNYHIFTKYMIGMSALILSLSVLIALCGSWFGLDILQLIYGTDLSSHRRIFFFLLLFGGIAAIAYFFSTLITIIRKQFYIILGYGSAFLLNLFLTRHLVSIYGISGAAYAYGAIVGCILVIYLFVLLYEIMKSSKSTRNRNQEGARS